MHETSTSQSHSRQQPAFLAYLNGDFLPAGEVRLSVFDQGIVHGLAVTEMLRTFGGCVDHWSPHCHRLQQSARACHIPLRESAADLEQIVTRVVDHNYAQLQPGLELGVIISATPGLNPTYTGCTTPTPTLYVHTFILPAELWAGATASGVHLAVSTVPQIPAASLPPQAKTRSRMVWHLADQQVRQLYPTARALLLDQFGFVCETGTANIFVVRGGRLMTPPEASVLPGVCRAVALELAAEQQIEIQPGPVTIDDLLQAEEAFVTSTPYGMLGVSRLNSTAVGLRFPGPVTQQILAAWNQRLGFDLHAQLREIARLRTET